MLSAILFVLDKCYFILFRYFWMVEGFLCYKDNLSNNDICFLKHIGTAVLSILLLSLLLALRNCLEFQQLPVWISRSTFSFSNISQFQYSIPFRLITSALSVTFLLSKQGLLFFSFVTNGFP